MLNVNSTRFNWVLEGRRIGPLPDCDVDLFNHADFAVTPSLGSLVPRWLLVVPRRPVRCLAQLDRGERTELMSLASKLRGFLADPNDKIFMFEHGASAPASSLNCGVDQAHLHIVPLPFDFLSSVLSATTLEWKSVPITDPWAGLKAREDYFFASNFENSLVARSLIPESQFFRKLIASHLGMPDAWDYKRNPFPENARQTIEAVHFCRAA